MITVGLDTDVLHRVDIEGAHAFVATPDFYRQMIESVSHQLIELGISSQDTIFFGVRNSGWQPALDTCAEFGSTPYSVEYHTRPMGSSQGVIELGRREDTGFAPAVLQLSDGVRLGIMPVEKVDLYSSQIRSANKVVVIDDQTTAGRVASHITREILEIDPSVDIYYAVLTRGIHFPTASDLGVRAIVSALIEDAYGYLEEDEAIRLGIMPGHLYFGDPELLTERIIKMQRGKVLHANTPKITYELLKRGN